MTDKEKYEQALERARDVYTYYCDDREQLRKIESIFPELKESEDERIREALIYHYQGDGCLCTNEYRIDYKDIRAWLEKQCESKPIGKLQLSEELYEHIRNTCACIDDALSSDTLADINDYLSMAEHSANSAFDMIEKQGEWKPADKVEPKFKVGDWVVTDKGDIIQIVTANFDYYIINNGMAFSMSYVDKYWHLWTIKDAKAGDVLVCKGNIKNSNGIKYERICLFNNIDNAFFTLTKTSNYVEEYDIDVNIDYPDNTVPATKEQKEILFMAMADAGYTFDFEKKELKKIEFSPDDYIEESHQQQADDLCNESFCLWFS